MLENSTGGFNSTGSFSRQFPPRLIKQNAPDHAGAFCLITGTVPVLMAPGLGLEPRT